MTDEPRRTALVTGASTGIGRAFAEHLASQGLDLVLTARRLDVLGKVAAEIQDRFEVDCRVIPADLAEPDAPRRIYYEPPATRSTSTSSSTTRDTACRNRFSRPTGPTCATSSR